MTINEVRKIAKGLELKCSKMKKADIILSIQKAEGNTPCFKCEGNQNCDQTECCWREDCLK